MATQKKAAGATAKFEVISPLQHDGEEYAIGETVELTEAQALALVPHTVKPLGKAE